MKAFLNQHDVALATKFLDDMEAVLKQHTETAARIEAPPPNGMLLNMGDYSCLLGVGIDNPEVGNRIKRFPVELRGYSFIQRNTFTAVVFKSARSSK